LIAQQKGFDGRDVFGLDWLWDHCSRGGPLSEAGNAEIHTPYADDAIRCIEMGAEDYLPKSFNPILLRARVTNALHKKRSRVWRENHVPSSLEAAMCSLR
jgi:hypothetical protein